jgi:hypothetical protein
MIVHPIVFLCTEGELTRERRGYFKAFSKIHSTICIPYDRKHRYDDLENLLPDEMQPLLILHLDSWPRLLPQGLVDSPYPTACFQIDTFEYPEDRAFFSMLFDYAFVFHPGFERKFERLGHPQSICIPHAVEADLFQIAESPRIYEVGWIGRLDGESYSIRRRYIQGLKERFVMNDIDRYYTLDEMAKIYQQSKIVINLSRDDYLQDANLRCFEVMASGALLITPQPTELSELGFTEGIHYISFQTESQMYELVEYYLKNEDERAAISQSARDLVMEKHTYDARVQTILETLSQNQGQLFAPARQWDKAQVQVIYLQYFAQSMMLEAAIDRLRQLRSYSVVKAWSMLPTILRCFAIKIRDSLL